MGLTDSLPGTYIPRDSISGNVKIIDPVHEVVHQGKHFTATHLVKVGTGTAVSVMMTTPAASVGYIHFVCSVSADKLVTWTLSEAPSATGGSALVALNNDRNSSTANPTTLAHTVTYTSAGTIMETHIVGSASTPQSKTGGLAEARNEWILKPSTKYLIYAIAAEADTNVKINLPFYYR